MQSERSSVLDPALLREIGEALDGQWFVRRLAARIQGREGKPIAPRTLERWLDAQSPIPEGMPAELVTAIDGKIAELRALRRKLRS